METTHIDNQDVINDEQFEDMRDLLEDDFAPLVQTFLSDSQQRLQRLISAQKNNDNAAGFDAAHAMKGASANLGAELLMKLSSDFQEACRHQNIGAQKPLLEQLSQALTLTEALVTQRLGLQ